MQLKPIEMSGGEKQRVAIARALAKKPQLLFADEPTSALDTANGKVVIDSLHRVARTYGATVVCVSHAPRHQRRSRDHDPGWPYPVRPDADARATRARRRALRKIQMPPAQTYRFLGLLAAVVTIAACSRSADHAGSAQAAPLAQPQFAAMARGRVDVEGGLVRIAAPRDGVIAELRLAAGDTVKQGDLIAVIDARQAELAAGVAKAEVDQAQARAAALRAKTGGLKLRASRVSQAAEAGAATGQSADDANQALTELNADIAEADAAVEVARQHLKQARYEVEVRSVRAPVAGRIVSRPAHIADVVSAQSGELARCCDSRASCARN